jgi:hypothetical protein
VYIFAKLRACSFATIELVDAVLENPIFVAALICFVLGFGLSGLVRILPVLALGSMVSPSVFLASYVLTYQQVPTFPPVGATNKIFYIAVVATLIGFILDLLPLIKNYGKIFAAIMSLSIVGWIAYPRFAKPDMDLIVTSLGLWLGGIALLWPLDTSQRQQSSVTALGSPAPRYWHHCCSGSRRLHFSAALQPA